MKRFLFAICLSFATAAMSGMLAPAVPALAQAESTAASQNVTGDWKVQITGHQFIVGNLHLSQVGDTVVGSGVAPSGKGVLQINGQLSGSKISGKWRGPTGETGWITLNFQTMSAFSGQWGYGGRESMGSIVAQKIRSTAF